MADSGGVLFSADAADRIARAVKRVEAEDGAGGGRRRVTPAGEVATVRVTSGTPDGDGYYPAVVTVEATETATWTDYAAVKAKGANGETLESGTRYNAVPVGKSGTTRLYQAVDAGGGGAVEIVTVPEEYPIEGKWTLASGPLGTQGSVVNQTTPKLYLTNRVTALPYRVRQSGTIDAIGVWVEQTASYNVRLSIYANTDRAGYGPYPGALLGTGTVSCSSNLGKGPHLVSVSVPVTAGDLIWVTLGTDFFGSGVFLRSRYIAECWAALAWGDRVGFDGITTLPERLLVSGLGWSAKQTYTDPTADPFPLTGCDLGPFIYMITSADAAELPMVGVRYARTSTRPGSSCAAAIEIEAGVPYAVLAKRTEDIWFKCTVAGSGTKYWKVYSGTYAGTWVAYSGSCAALTTQFSKSTNTCDTASTSDTTLYLKLGAPTIADGVVTAVQMGSGSCP